MDKQSTFWKDKDDPHDDHGYVTNENTSPCDWVSIHLWAQLWDHFMLIHGDFNGLEPSFSAINWISFTVNLIQCWYYVCEKQRKKKLLLDFICFSTKFILIDRQHSSLNCWQLKLFSINSLFWVYPLTFCT